MGAERVAEELRVAAQWAPPGPAQATLHEARRLLLELAPVQAQRDALAGEVRALKDALEQDRACLPDGVYLLTAEPGGISRRWLAVPGGDAATLDALLPRAAVLRHHDAITRATVSLLDAVRQGVRRDEHGVPHALTWESAAEWADRICACIAADLEAREAPH